MITKTKVNSRLVFGQQPVQRYINKPNGRKRKRGKLASVQTYIKRSDNKARSIR